MDNVFLGIYILELQLKFYVHRSRFFQSGWNNFGASTALSGSDRSPQTWSAAALSGSGASKLWVGGMTCMTWWRR